MTSRLDTTLADRGLARSRTHAATLISEGRVTVDGVAVLKASARIAPDAAVAVAAADHYVSRAAHKLIAGLDAWPIAVAGRLALDLGASTGGFTQVLRERGAAPVIAVDVGHGQLAASVAADPAVVAVEGVNVRYMSPASLQEATGIGAAPELITGDLSFISLVHVLPAVREVAAPGGDIVLLVKPQFEVGRTAVKEGVVSAPRLRAEAVEQVLWAAWDLGLGTRGVLPSPLPGAHGNHEYLIWIGADGGTGPTEWLSSVGEMTGAG